MLYLSTQTLLTRYALWKCKTFVSYKFIDAYYPAQYVLVYPEWLIDYEYRVKMALFSIQDDGVQLRHVIKDICLISLRIIVKKQQW